MNNVTAYLELFRYPSLSLSLSVHKYQVKSIDHGTFLCGSFNV